VTETLLKVQEIDCQIREKEQMARDIPARKKEEEVRLQKHREALAAAEEFLKKKQSQIKQLELEGEARRQRINKLRTQQFEIKTNEEFKALNSEIAGVQAEISGLEDKELSLMEEQDAARAETLMKKAALGEEEAAVRRDCSTWDEKIAVIQNELQALRATREAAASGVDRTWLNTYSTIFARRDRALVPVEEGVCGGCHMTLPRYLVHDARSHTKMVKCDYCGRLLY
jgi:predicted  nucleic acid-binding Zn-ribbon protein